MATTSRPPDLMAASSWLPMVWRLMEEGVDRAAGPNPYPRCQGEAIRQLYVEVMYLEERLQTMCVLKLLVFQASGFFSSLSLSSFSMVRLGR